MTFSLAARMVVALALSASAFAQSHWIGTWGASPSPQQTAEQMNKARLVFANQTLREIVHTSAGGAAIRVRLSNAYGRDSLEIGAAHVAIRQKGAAIEPGSDHALTFSGRPSVTIPPNAVILSDVVPLQVKAASDLAISIFLPKPVTASGIHYSAFQTNYIGSGDLTASSDIADASTIRSWVFLTGVDVAAPSAAGTLVAFGDSITDGASSTLDANHRWPDLLSDRLTAGLADGLMKRADAQDVGVLDEGIGGNRLLHDPNKNVAFGVNALARYDRDVLAQSAVKYVIVLEGINDLGQAGPDLSPNEQVSAADIIAGLKQLIERAHENNVRIYGGTLTPFMKTPIPGYYSDAKEKMREAVNEWIRTSHVFDAVIDFDKALQDPANPNHMLAAFDSGDHLHPNDSGYKAMAEAVDLSLFAQ